MGFLLGLNFYSTTPRAIYCGLYARSKRAMSSFFI
jgi:hypothetical protein